MLPVPETLLASVKSPLVLKASVALSVIEPAGSVGLVVPSLTCSVPALMLRPPVEVADRGDDAPPVRGSPGRGRRVRRGRGRRAQPGRDGRPPGRSGGAAGRPVEQLGEGPAAAPRGLTFGPPPASRAAT